jgi:hypothetical protein
VRRGSRLLPGAQAAAAGISAGDGVQVDRRFWDVELAEQDRVDRAQMVVALGVIA